MYGRRIVAMLEIYTDGSSTKTRSGWGFVVVGDNKQLYTAAGEERGATNQRMELRAALEALKWWEKGPPAAYPDVDPEVTIYSDSAYFCNCYFDKWWINWENNGWVNSKKEPVANQDLWQELVIYFKNPYVHIAKVKGHSGHTYNELADKLATGVKLRDEQLTINEKDDKINIELSEILLDYSMRKYPVDETIKRIRKVCNCE